MKTTLNNASDESRTLGMYLLSRKEHDASDECQFELMHPQKVTQKMDASLSYTQMQMRQELFYMHEIQLNKLP
jgi:hypothetical protein